MIMNCVFGNKAQPLKLFHEILKDNWKAQPLEMFHKSLEDNES